MPAFPIVVTGSFCTERRRSAKKRASSASLMNSGPPNAGFAMKGGYLFCPVRHRFTGTDECAMWQSKLQRGWKLLSRVLVDAQTDVPEPLFFAAYLAM